MKVCHDNGLQHNFQSCLLRVPHTHTVFRYKFYKLWVVIRFSPASEGVSGLCGVLASSTMITVITHPHWCKLTLFRAFPGRPEFACHSFVVFATFCHNLTITTTRTVIKGHWNWVLLNFEITVLILRILWF